MREYDEMSTGEFWQKREAQLRADAKAAAEYAGTPEAAAEAARKEENYQAWLGPQAAEKHEGLDAETKNLFAKYIK